MLRTPSTADRSQRQQPPQTSHTSNDAFRRQSIDYHPTPPSDVTTRNDRHTLRARESRDTFGCHHGTLVGLSREASERPSGYPTSIPLESFRPAPTPSGLPRIAVGRNEVKSSGYPNQQSHTMSSASSSRLPLSSEDTTVERCVTVRHLAQTPGGEPGREDIKESEIVLAFPVTEAREPVQRIQDVHAFLPLRCYGFKV